MDQRKSLHVSFWSLYSTLPISAVRGTLKYHPHRCRPEWVINKVTTLTLQRTLCSREMNTSHYILTSIWWLPLAPSSLIHFSVPLLFLLTPPSPSTNHWLLPSLQWAATHTLGGGGGGGFITPPWCNRCSAPAKKAFIYLFSMSSTA